MLQIKNICKTYHTGSLTQQALDHVSLNLRDSEFVAILGQSGSGKTTLLNIIGGLDRYDEGDLIINGVSTKKYSDRDWDSYRNHTVGFVFQSYNLIPHQTIQANVELALTIGGISRRERSRRAVEALEKVGLGDHIHKRPAQLSGGQMQRVAIARALVNDPDILLADEPTGALDSDTSIQVMDLLKEVARDRLVVMVTHNPDLANQYATRIVNLRDGVILSDSDPYTPEEGESVHRNLGKASMSFLTALLLSFNNLRTKKARTILVAFAGSIGIIGIAMILSLSNGVDVYIQQVEEETLQGYPLQITQTSFDLSTVYQPGGGRDDEETPQEKDVREWRTITSMLSRVTTNDLTSLKDYLDNGGSGIERYARSIEYDYGVTPQIYALRDGKVRQVNPDNSFSSLGFSSAGTGSFISAYSSTSSFHALPAEPELYMGQYDVKAGRWPENDQECVVVVSQGGWLADLTLYTLGLQDPEELDEMIQAFSEGENPQVDDTVHEYDYEEFLGITFRVVNRFECYVYDPSYQVWTDKSGDETFLRDVVARSAPLTVVGVVQAREEATTPILTSGISYPAELTGSVIEAAAGSDIVKAQMAAPAVNVFTGKRFDDAGNQSGMDLSTLFSVDEDAMARAFQFGDMDFSDMDLSELDLSEVDFSDMDLSGMDLSDMDLSGLDLGTLADTGDFSAAMPSFTEADVAGLLGSIQIDLSEEMVRELFENLVGGYLTYAAADPSTDFSRLPESLEAFLQSDQLRQVLLEDIQGILEENAEAAITAAELENIIIEVLAGYPAYLADNGILIEDQPFSHLSEYLQTPETQTVIDDQAAYLQRRLGEMTISTAQRDKLLSDVLGAYRSFAAENDMPDVALLGDSFMEYLQTPWAQELILSGVSQALDTSELESRLAVMLSSFSGALGAQISAVMEQMITALGEQLVTAMTDAVASALTESMSGYMEQVMEQMGEALAEQFSSGFQVDLDAFSGAVSMNISENDLRDLMMSVMSTEVYTYEGNLRKLNYADLRTPTTITIYPRDFESKAAVKDILTGYNDMQTAAGEDEKVIVYTDVVDTLMSSVTDIVDAISYVLIAFVAISLVVSSIMIGVITYISVLERNKEIGILRAIGASKRNISEVFNAETFIIGALAGVIGILITLLLLIPTNYIIHSLTDQTNINAMLPPGAAVGLVILSIILTLIGGIIPSRKAARSDPVAALRSE